MMSSILLCFIFLNLLITISSFRSPLKSSISRINSIKLNDAQKFTSFDDMLVKIDKPVLVDFFALWCGPCKMMVPVLEDLAGRMDESIKVAKVDTDKYPKLGTNTLTHTISLYLYIIYYIVIILYLCMYRISVSNRGFAYSYTV